MIGEQFISFKEIIEQVYAQNGYTYELPEADLVTWMSDCLELIGHPSQFETRIAGHKDYPPFDITNYRAALPCGFHKLRQIAVDGFAAYPSNHSFHYLMDGDCCGLNEIQANLGDTFADNFNNQFNTSLGTKYKSEPVTYTLNNDFIVLSVKSGKVCMSFLSMVLDDEGFPMIPKDVSYRQAVQWYLTSKLDYIGWRKGEISDKVMAKSEQEWLWFVGSAANKAKMPDENQMANIKNMMLRLKPKINQEDGFYKYLSFREQRKLK